MPGTVPLPHWGDGSLYGDGDVYTSLYGITAEYIVEREETECQYLSITINYTSSSISEDFLIYSIRPRLSPLSRKPYAYEAFVDATTPSERLGVTLSHSGSELMIYDIRLVAQRKKHLRKG